MDTAVEKAQIRDLGLMGGLLANDVVHRSHNAAAEYFL